MKSLGIVRKFDGLGRVVIPIELRNKLGIKEGIEIEIYSKGSEIILKKYEDTNCPNCAIKNEVITRVEHTDKFCKECGINFKEFANGGKK